jgi:hypothetical protein
MCFSAAASSENDHGSMYLASKTAPVSLTKPSSVAPIQGMVLWTAWRWMSEIRWPESCSYQRRFEVLGHQPELDDQDAREVDRRRFSPFFLPKTMERLFVLAHDDPGVRAGHSSAVHRIGVFSHLSLSLRLPRAMPEVLNGQAA